MEHDLSLRLAQSIVLCGLASWMSLAVFNNIIDRGTNTTLLHRMLSMSLLKADPELGEGLEDRAIDRKETSALLLRLVIVVQVLISLLMIVGAALFILGVLNGSPQDYKRGVSAATLGLSAFGSLWFFFLCGGLYFGYWMKMPQVQQVHLSLVIITLLSLIFLRM